MSAEGAHLLEDARKYAPVLERMVDILSKDNMTFEAALQRAARELELEIPEHVQAPLIVTAFKIFAGGRIPGLPEA
jgi:hypothetical protein